MILTIVILSLTTSILCVLGIIWFKMYKSLKVKYNDLKLGLKSMYDNSRNRKGFKDVTVTHTNKILNTKGDYDVRMEVTELEEYKNGYSKLEYGKCYIISGASLSEFAKKDIINFCKTNNAPEIGKTKNITWLESVSAEQELRNRKMKTLIKLHKDEEKI